VLPYPRNQGLARSSPGVRLLFRALLLHVRPLSPLLRIRPAYASRIVPEPCGSASREVLPPTNTTTSGAPFQKARSCDRSSGRGSPAPRRCRPQGSCPSRRFRLRTRHCMGPCRTHRFTVAPRRFAALFHAARVPMEIPSRAFPSRGAVPALAGLCFLAGSRSDCRRRDGPEIFAIAFPVAPALCLAAHPEVNRDA